MIPVSGTIFIILAVLGVVIYLVEWSMKAKRALSRKPPFDPYGDRGRQRQADNRPGSPRDED